MEKSTISTALTSSNSDDTNTHSRMEYIDCFDTNTHSRMEYIDCFYTNTHSRMEYIDCFDSSLSPLFHSKYEI